MFGKLLFLSLERMKLLLREVSSTNKTQKKSVKKVHSCYFHSFFFLTQIVTIIFYIILV